MKKQTIYLHELSKAIGFINYLNSIDLRNIEWVDFDGNPILISKEQIKEWELTGLNNKDFAVFNILNK